MNRFAIVLIALLLFGTASWIPATAQTQQTDQPAASTDTSTTPTDTTAKDKEEKERKEREAEYKARAEAEKKQRVEDRRHRRSRGYDHRRGSDDNGDYQSGSSDSSALSFIGDAFDRCTVGLVVAPSGSNGKAAIGLQWISKARWGLAFWTSGNPDRGGDVIDAAIPHDDYYRESDKGDYGVQGLYGLGSDKSMLILGVGIAVELTDYTAVSNVTGWKWVDGSASTTKFAGQIGYRAKFAERVGMQIGYDTNQRGYFGFNMSF